MNTLMLVVVITLLFVVIWVARLHDQGRADDAARERRYRAEVRAAADREHARRQAMAHHPTTRGNP